MMNSEPQITNLGVLVSRKQVRLCHLPAKEVKGHVALETECGSVQRVVPVLLGGADHNHQLYNM